MNGTSVNKYGENNGHERGRNNKYREDRTHNPKDSLDYLENLTSSKNLETSR